MIGKVSQPKIMGRLGMKKLGIRSLATTPALLREYITTATLFGVKFFSIGTAAQLAMLEDTTLSYGNVL